MAGRKRGKGAAKGRTGKAHVGRAPKKRMTKEERVNGKIQALFVRGVGAKWKGKSQLLADGIIKICVEEKIPLEVMKDRYLRRVEDAGTLQAITKRMNFLLKQRKTVP